MRFFGGGRQYFGSRVSQVQSSAVTTSSSPFAFGTCAFVVDNDRTSPVGVVFVAANSGASARTLTSLEAYDPLTGLYPTVTEVCKIDGVGNFCGLYLVDLEGHIDGTAAELSLTLTTSGSVTNGVTAIFATVEYPERPLSYNSSTNTAGSTDPADSNITWNGSGLLLWGATSNNTTSGQAWFGRFQGTSSYTEVYRGQGSSSVVSGSRTHTLFWQDRYSASDNEDKGFESLSGLNEDYAGTKSVGADYSSDGTNPSVGTVSASRLLAIAID